MRLELHPGSRFLDKLKLALLGPIYVVVIILWLTNSEANQTTLDRVVRSDLLRFHAALLPILNSCEKGLILVHIL